jgi:hypothetical protein
VAPGFLDRFARFLNELPTGKHGPFLTSVFGSIGV